MRARRYMSFAIATLALIMLPPLARAEGGRAYIAPYAGFTKMDDSFGDIVLHDKTINAKDAINFGGRLGILSGSGLGIEIAGGFTPSKLERDTPAIDGDLTWWFATGNIVYMPEVERWGSPFLSAGFGYGNNTLKNVVPAGGAALYGGDDPEQVKQGLLDLAAGWVVPLGSRMGLRLEARNLLWIPKKKMESAQLNYLLFGGALQFSFGGGGKPVDTDGDGVSDKKDKCPGTPAGATVDVTGCPTDSDGDGVFDGLDQCAGTPKGVKVDAKGCPTDSDGDGVFDGVDQCADTPKGATVDAKGCPTDSDGDGVFDGLDQCANTPTGVTVDSKGCPVDSDGDGVFDGVDKCANTPAGVKVDVDGCPIEITERETELLDTGMIRLQNVNFETGKADILPESDATLDIVGTLLTRWPQLKMEIGGHTDSRGTAAANQKLSEARAQSVLNYLITKFPDLKAEQFTVKGYGESKPVAPNNNQLNMAKNRRVEFVVQNKDVLKKEVEKRKLLQK